MTKKRRKLFSRIVSGTADFFVSWWREATGPIPWHYHNAPWKALLQRVALWLPVLVLAVALLGAATFQVFTGWRAGDLAEKALANARAGNLAMARLQIASAENLRSGSPGVRRAKIFVRSRLGDPAANESWEELAAQGSLTPEEIEERARLAAQFGSDAQFERAVADLDQSGHSDTAAAFRSSRLLRRGDLSASIGQARAAAEAAPGDDARKLDLIRLLLARHAPLLNQPRGVAPDTAAAAQEMVALVDELRATPSGNRAIASVLGAFPLPAPKAREWAEAALQDLSASNPALLPAAQFMVTSGGGTAREYFAKLSPVFEGADIGQQAQLAQWLNRQEMWEESLALITAAKAARDARAYEVRGQALAGKRQWQELLAMSEAPSNAPESLRLVLRGYAAAKLGKTGIAPKSLADALRASVRDGRLPETLAALDSMGEGKIASPVIVEMCASPGLADVALRVARDRFSRRGERAALQAAWEAAAKAAPDAPSVRDYRRRLRLLAGKPVAGGETLAAIEAAPADPQPRFTHALALLEAGRPAAALGVFHDMDIFVDHLAPGDQAIVIAIWEANGLKTHAATLRRSLDPDLLQKGEYALILR